MFPLTSQASQHSWMTRLAYGLIFGCVAVRKFTYDSYDRKDSGYSDEL